MNGICFCVNLFKFDGFTVQQGMIYGTYRGRKIVTNGLKCGQPQGKGRYYPVYFQRMNEALETSWERCALSFYDDPILFDKIERMAEKREAKGIELHYLTPAELEQKRWEKDLYHHHFQAHDPFATPKVTGIARPQQAAKYNASKERKCMTQRVNTVIYINGNNVTVI